MHALLNSNVTDLLLPSDVVQCMQHNIYYQKEEVK